MRLLQQWAAEMAQWEIMQAYGLSWTASTYRRQELTDAHNYPSQRLQSLHTFFLSRTHTNKNLLIKDGYKAYSIANSVYTVFQLACLGNMLILSFSHPKGYEMGFYLTVVFTCIVLKPKQLPFDGR